MLMERNAWARKKDFGRCVPRLGQSPYLYYDSSPQAQHEIFGTVLDSFDVDGHRMRILPGTTLAHGCQGAVDKLFALLWSMWMVFGPTMAGLGHACCETRSLTSDFGTESVTGAMHNVLHVFAARLNLKVSDAFNSFGHVFPNAVVIVDWHHLVSAAVKTTLNSLSAWPDMLAKMRAVSTFLRVDEYRSVFRRHMQGLDAEIALQTFTASFAKWR